MIFATLILGCATSGVVVEVDITKNVRPINPDIYGVSVSEGAANHFEDMGVSVVRWGGNARSRFNWEINASNAGSDWEFRNQSKGDDTPGSAAIDFHNINRSVGAKSLVTVPMIGWVANDGDSNTRSVDVPERTTNAYDPARNMERTSFPSYARKNGAFEYPPNLDDDAVYQNEWIHYLTQTIGNAQSGGIQFYEMDNEPMLWNITHRDVRSSPIGYDEYFDMFIEYANAVKDVDPTAQVVGPAAWGWMSYFYSALDEGGDNFRTAAERAAHDDEPFMPWFLDKVRESDEVAGRRSLDALSIHYYPQGDQVHSDDFTDEVQALRLRSTRSLWDSDYTDESWISRTKDGPVVRLIPRMREWVDEHYPGTRLAVTEWNWGADDHISGGLAVGDVLGIFGREGVDLATHWGVPEMGSPAYWVFRLFRGYDGQGGKFGDISVMAESSNANLVASYASTSTETNELTTVLINKSPLESIDVRISLNGVMPNSEVTLYQYGETTPDGIVLLAPVKLNDTELTYTLPPYSITLVVAQTQAS